MLYDNFFTSPKVLKYLGLNILKYVNLEGGCNKMNMFD